MAHPPVRALMVTRRAPGRVRNHTTTTARPLFLFARGLIKRAELHRAKAGAVNSAAGSEERGNRLREVASRCVQECVENVGRSCVGVDGEFDEGAILRAVVRPADFDLFAVGTHVPATADDIASSTGRRSANDLAWSTDVSLTAVRDPNAQRGVALHPPPRERL